MHSAATNSKTKGRLNISHVRPRFGSTKLVAAITRSLTLAVIAVLVLVATRPAQAQTETVLHNFCYYATECPYDIDGFDPESGLASDGAGNFYGTTAFGGSFGVTGYEDGAGTVFEASPNGSGGWNETVLYSFCSAPSCADGAIPYYSNVIFDGVGNLYGTTEMGGAYGYGVVFELSPVGGGWTETVLHSFDEGTDGAYPVNGLIMDSAGNLYGKTTYGAGGDSGVFELSPADGGWTEQVIYGGGQFGSNYGGLSIDTAGNIFGTTGTTVFELSLNGSGGWTPTVIHTFAGGLKDGTSANCAPVPDPSGNLYGTTASGGAHSDGTVYRLSPVTKGKKKGTWKEKILYSFKGGTKDGSEPSAGIVLDAAGNIYGTTQLGVKYTCGTLGCGTVFELVAPIGTGSYKEKLLWSFNGTDGYGPLGNLTLDSAGNLYSTTIEGGSTYGAQSAGYGVVFEVTP
jgi:uncharacterized repeat protein (TIGR03803 family)